MMVAPQEEIANTDRDGIAEAGFRNWPGDSVVGEQPAKSRRCSRRRTTTCCPVAATSRSMSAPTHLLSAGYRDSQCREGARRAGAAGADRSSSPTRTSPLWLQQAGQRQAQCHRSNGKSQFVGGGIPVAYPPATFHTDGLENLHGDLRSGGELERLASSAAACCSSS